MHALPFSQVKMKNGQFFLQHNNLEKDCPLVIALKAMGLESDQDIIQMIGSSGSEASMFIPSLEECTKLGVFSQDSALRCVLCSCSSSFLCVISFRF